VNIFSGSQESCLPVDSLDLTHEFLVQGDILNVGGDALRLCNRRIMRQNSKYFENHTHKKTRKLNWVFD